MYNIKNIICNIWWDKLSKATEKFKCNYNRLLLALNIGNLTWSGWHCWSVKIQPFVPLSERFKWKLSIEWIWKLSYWNEDDWISNWWTSDTKALNQMKKDLSKYWPYIDWLKQLWSDLKHTALRTPIKTPSSNITNKPMKVNEIDFQNNFQNNLDMVVNDENYATKELSEVEPWKATHSITTLFPEISKKLYLLDKLSEQIYKNTAKACANQSPQIWNCYVNK